MTNIVEMTYHATETTKAIRELRRSLVNDLHPNSLGMDNLKILQQELSSIIEENRLVNEA